MITVRPHDGLLTTLDDAESLFSTPPLTGGAENTSHQHGRAVDGLLTPAMNEMNSSVPIRSSRISFEMFRAVPVSELRVEARLERA
jgi:hypothetical protein